MDASRRADRASKDALRRSRPARRSQAHRGRNDGRRRFRPAVVRSRENSRGLLDTSVLIAIESGRPLRTEAMPETTAISVVTKAELRVGIFAAEDIETRNQRLMTF